MNKSIWLVNYTNNPRINLYLNSEIFLILMFILGLITGWDYLCKTPGLVYLILPILVQNLQYVTLSFGKAYDISIFQKSIRKLLIKLISRFNHITLISSYIYFNYGILNSLVMIYLLKHQ